MSVTAPEGFAATGVAAGMRASGRPDLALLVTQRRASAAGLFTTNAFPAAPVRVTQRHLLGGTARAIVVNSGQANAGTGAEGIADAEATCAAVAKEIGAEPVDVLVCSTGVIGPRVKLAELTAAIPGAVERLNVNGGPSFARAILTTDGGPKETTVSGDGFVVGGCVKGAGMVAPNLATLLAFLTTDAQVEPPVLDGLARRAVAPVFNALTVDGCTSTNDTVLLLASGASEVQARRGTRALAELESTLRAAAEDLARQVVRDAEGATKTFVSQVTGAADRAAAVAVARALTGSLLVKTMLFGSDPNPGRLLQAVGAVEVPLIPDLVRIEVAGHRVVANGAVAAFDAEACREALKEREVVVRVDLGLGSEEATSFGCDLGYEYVRINAEYTT